MILDCTAEYITDGDTILAAAYVYDEGTELFHPELVKSGTVQLKSNGQNIGQEMLFDRRMGNADGSFKFTFAHPLKTSNLHLYVTVGLFDGSAFAKSVNVVVSTDDVEIPLAKNLLQEPIDTNSIRRAEEDLL